MGVVEEDEEERKLLNRKMGRSSRQKQRILIESGWAERQRRRRLVSDGWASRGAPLAGLPCMATTAPACLNRSSRWPCPVSLALLRNVATPRLSPPDDDPTTSATPAAAVLVRAQGDLATAVEATASVALARGSHQALIILGLSDVVDPRRNRSDKLSDTVSFFFHSDAPPPP